MVEKMTYTLNSVSFHEVAWKFDKDQVDELSLSVHADEFYGDFSIRWVRFKNGDVHPLLRAFSDSWSAVALVLPVLEQFNDSQPTPQEIIAALDEAGWMPSEYHGQEYAGYVPAEIEGVLASSED